MRIPKNLPPHRARVARMSLDYIAGQRRAAAAAKRDAAAAAKRDAAAAAAMPGRVKPALDRTGCTAVVASGPGASDLMAWIVNSAAAFGFAVVGVDRKTNGALLRQNQAEAS